MSEPTIALAFTPEVWVEELHRHCTDHGGARVRQVLIDPALALEEQYDVLVVSHRWPALTHGLVDDLHARGRKVLGVHERDEPVGRDWLIAVGADATVTSDDGAAGIVAALRALHRERTNEAASPAVAEPEPAKAATVVVAGPAGAGATEIAIALAVALGEATLVDADDVAPAIAPRLGLGLEPNLRGALDALEYEGQEPDRHLVGLRDTGVRVLGGLPSTVGWPQLRPTEVLRLLERLAGSGSATAPVVVNVAGALEDLPVSMARPRHAIARAALLAADEIVAVGIATPVGVIALLRHLGEVRALVPARARLHVVVNRAPKGAFRRGEVVEEVGRSFDIASVTVVPHDRRVERAAWDGATVARGPFTRAVATLATAVSDRPRVEDAVDELELRVVS